MTYRPALAISLYLDGKRIVLVGQGARAGDRANRLRRAGARVVRKTAEEFEPDDCRGAFLVMAHTGDRACDATIAQNARAAGCLCYVHDQPELSDFAMPALATRGPLSLAVSTDGTAPALSRRVRESLQAWLDRAGARLDRLLEDLARARAALPAAQRGPRLRELAQRFTLRGHIHIAGAHEITGASEGPVPARPEPDRD